MGQCFHQRTLHGLLGGTALWVLLGISSPLAYFGSDEIGAMPAQMRADRYASDILVAQFHEPHLPPPPVVPSTAPPVMPPPVQPKVFVPIPLPPDSQAIKSGGGTKPSSAPASGSSSSSTASSSASSAPAPSKPKSSADPTVKGLQQILADMGYDPGPADGLAGSRTMNAIFTWIADIKDPDLQQEARNAAHAGQYELVIEYAYGEKERRAGAFAMADATMADANAAIASTAAAGAEQAGAQEANAIAAQANQTAVKSLQQSLASLGFDPGPADGIPGNRTNDALNDWLSGLEDPALRQQAMKELEAGDYIALAELADQATQQSVAPGEEGAVARNGASDKGSASPSGGTMQLADSGPTDGLAGDHTVGAVNNWIDRLEDADAQEQARYAEENGEYGMLNAILERTSKAPPTFDEPLDENDFLKPKNSVPTAPSEDAEQIFGESEDYLLQTIDIVFEGTLFGVDKLSFAPLYNNAHVSGSAHVQSLNDYISWTVITINRYVNEIIRSSAELQRRQSGYYKNLFDDIVNLDHVVAYYEQWIHATAKHIERDPRPEVVAKQKGILDAYKSELAGVKEQRDALLEAFKAPYAAGKTREESIAKYKAKIESAKSNLMKLVKVRDEMQAALANVDANSSGDYASLVDLTVAREDRLQAALEQAQQVTDGSLDVAMTPEEVAIMQAQNDIDFFDSNVKQANAELTSILARPGISREEKTRLVKDIASRINASEVFAKEAQIRLAALGGEYDGYQGKDFEDFDPYAINQTDVELYRIAEKAEAAEQYFDELSRARNIIASDAEGLDAVTLNEHVTELSERVVDSAESYNKVADLLHAYGTDIHVTRKQGELEYAQAMAEDAVWKAEKNLAYAKSVVQTTKNAEAILALGGLGYALATGGVAATVVVGVQSQAVMATLDGASSAIDGFSKDGFVAGLKEGALQAGKYYVPINTYLAVRDGHTDKLTLSLAIAGDAANLFSSFQTLKSVVNRAYAAQAKLTQMTLSESDQAISRAAQAAKQHGDDLVRGYQNARFELDVAKRSGIGSEVAAAQDRLEAIVRAIDTSDEAKLALKAKSLSVQAEFVDDQARIIKDPVQKVYDKNMRDLGWTEAGLETEQIRNASSAGTVGLDEDLRIVEPTLNDRVSAPSLNDTLPDGSPKYLGAEDPIFLRDTKNYNMHPEKLKYTGPTDPSYVADTKAFRSRLLKNGKPQTLAVWEQDSTYAVNEAYKEVAGYEAKQARVNMTTTVNEEAFKDIRLLDSGVNSSSAGWAEQSASVTQEKMKYGIAYANELGLGDGPATGALSGVSLQEATTEIKVATRELLKDLTGKALKAKPGFEMPAKIDRQIQILQGVVDGTYDPAVANALLKKQTGTSLAKTMESLGGHFEVLLKFE